MDQERSRTGSEDASEAREHVREARENREAQEAQADRIDATAPADVASRPVRGLDATERVRGEGSEDASRAAAHAENAERNRDALEAQNRRVEETAPDSVDRDLRDR
ncbi:MAG TPA: hypothetical protein VFQ39_11605 [Longimicrobium sp.]|nr:hypothetical protein [Longimicrobium sp.]